MSLEQGDRDWIVRYFERVITDQDKRIEQALTAARSAVDKAEKAQERRLDLLNEFRAQAADEAQKYALRVVVEQTFRDRDARLSRLERALNIAYGAIITVALVGVVNLVKLFTG